MAKGKKKDEPSKFMLLKQGDYIVWKFREWVALRHGKWGCTANIKPGIVGQVLEVKDHRPGEKLFGTEVDCKRWAIVEFENGGQVFLQDEDEGWFERVLVH